MSIDADLRRWTNSVIDESMIFFGQRQVTISKLTKNAKKVKTFPAAPEPDTTTTTKKK